MARSSKPTTTTSKTKGRSSGKGLQNIIEDIKRGPGAKAQKTRAASDAANAPADAAPVNSPAPEPIITPEETGAPTANAEPATAKPTNPVEEIAHAAPETATNITPPTVVEPAAPSAAPEKLSGLDAAAKILKDSGEALSSGELVQRIFAQGLWASAGKTPAATVYSAILREVQKRGAEARFCKDARGKFRYNTALG